MLCFWHMAKSRKHPFEDSPFLEGLLEWVESPDGQEHMEMLDVLSPLMKPVKLDAGKRKFIWPDNRRLNFDNSVRHIRKLHPHFKPEGVKMFLVSWIEHYAPDDMTQEQLDELDELAEEWVDDIQQNNM